MSGEECPAPQPSAPGGEPASKSVDPAHRTPRRRRRQSKVGRVAHELLHRKLTRFDAERELADHVLPSTVSSIQAAGIPVERETVEVPGYGSSRVRCARYWIAPENAPRVRRIYEI